MDDKLKLARFFNDCFFVFNVRNFHQLLFATLSLTIDRIVIDNFCAILKSNTGQNGNFNFEDKRGERKNCNREILDRGVIAKLDNLLPRFFRGAMYRSRSLSQRIW